MEHNEKTQQFSAAAAAALGSSMQLLACLYHDGQTSMWPQDTQRLSLQG